MLRDFKTLLYMEFAQFKNKFKYALSNPVTAIKQLGTFMFPIIIVLINLLGKKSKKKTINYISAIGSDIIGLLIITVLFIIVLYILFKASTNYKPLNFTIQDVHYLFPSPIGEKSLWIFSIIIGAMGFIISYFFISLFVWAIFLKKIKISILKLVISSLAVAIIQLFFKSLNYLLYSIKIRYNAEKLVKILAKLFMAAIVLYLGVVFYFYANKSLLETVSIVSYRTPVLSWMKDIIIFPITVNEFPIIQFFLILILTVIVFISSVVFAVDYYEVVSENIELSNSSIKDVDIDIDKVILEETVSIDEKEVRNIKEGFFHRIKGEGAFLYKNSLLFNRKSSLKKRLINCVILAIVFGTFGYFLYKYTRNIDREKLQLIILIIGLGIYGGVNPVSSIKYELTKIYIYLMPGSINKKVLCVVFHDYLSNIMVLVSILIPFCVMIKINIVLVIFYIIALELVTIARGLSKIIVHFFIPVDYKGSGGIVESILQYIMFLIPIFVGIFVYMFTKNEYISILCTGGIGLIFIIFILYLSEKLFNYVELR